MRRRIRGKLSLWRIGLLLVLAGGVFLVLIMMKDTGRPVPVFWSGGKPVAQRSGWYWADSAFTDDNWWQSYQLLNRETLVLRQQIGETSLEWVPNRVIKHWAASDSHYLVGDLAKLARPIKDKQDLLSRRLPFSEAEQLPHGAVKLVLAGALNLREGEVAFALAQDENGEYQLCSGDYLPSPYRQVRYGRVLLPTLREIFVDDGMIWNNGDDLKLTGKERVELVANLQKVKPRPVVVYMSEDLETSDGMEVRSLEDLMGLAVPELETQVEKIDGQLMLTMYLRKNLLVPEHLSVVWEAKNIPLAPGTWIAAGTQVSFYLYEILSPVRELVVREDGEVGFDF